MRTDLVCLESIGTALVCLESMETDWEYSRTWRIQTAGVTAEKGYQFLRWMARTMKRPWSPQSPGTDEDPKGLRPGRFQTEYWASSFGRPLGFLISGSLFPGLREWYWCHNRAKCSISC